MTRDFGAGLSVDELIGCSAWYIFHLVLPDEEVFQTTMTAAELMVEADLESYILMELWEDGHTVWMSPAIKRPVVVTPDGEMIKTKS